MASYLAELKQQSLAVYESSAAVDRGYFSPGEDEQTQAILVSYWQSRIAGLDLVNDFRQRDFASSEEHSTAFLVGFAAALLLVDAARFLRKQVAGRAVIRRKLNQPIPECAIPGGAYDDIQKSLSSARHAWSLYQARTHFLENQPVLRQVSERAGIEDVFAMVQALLGQVEVSLGEFAGFRWRTRIDQWIRRLSRGFFARPAYRVQKLGSEMMADVYVKPGHRPRLPDVVVESLGEMLQPGDVLLVRKEFALTNYFLPGYWPHAALYLGTLAELESAGLKNEAESSRWQKIESAGSVSGRCVLESMKDGVNLRCWNSPLASNSMIVMRPRIEHASIVAALRRVMVHEGKPYDFDFNLSKSDRLVCTEIVYRAYDGIGEMDFPLKIRAGRPTLSGSDLVDMALAGENFSIVASFVPTKNDQLIIGPEAVQSVRAVHGDA